MKRAVLLLGIGLLQMTGEALRLPVVRGLGAATGASPAPRVFSAVRGLETYSTRFTLEWKDERGRVHDLLLTPNVYARLRGPYNRRNVYGAALAYGPILSTDPRTRALFAAVATHSFCGAAPLLRELGIDSAAGGQGVRVRLEPRPGSQVADLPLVLQIACP